MSFLAHPVVCKIRGIAVVSCPSVCYVINIFNLQTVVSRRLRRVSTYGSRDYGHAGPFTWNALPNIFKRSIHS